MSGKKIGRRLRISLVTTMCTLVALSISAGPTRAAAPTFDVGLDGSTETSWSYVDTSVWDEFNDITASIDGGAIDNTGWTSIAPPIVAPNTDVITYSRYKNGSYGRMFLGQNSGVPYFTYVVDSIAINSLVNGVTASDQFGFTVGSDSSTFTVNVSGASDAPNVTSVIADITDGLASTEGGNSPRLPTGASGAGLTAFGFSSTGTTPNGERVEKAFDGLASTKYLNFGGDGSDVIIDAGEAFIVSGVTLVSGNDEPGRDPKSLEVYGSNSAFTSASDMTSWMAGATQLGSTVALSPPIQRQATYPKATISNPNRLDFRYLRLRFPTIVSTNGSMQVSEIRIEGNKKSSEATFAQSGGPVVIMGDTSILGENPTGATLTLTGSVSGDVLSCTACPVNGYIGTWDSTSKTLTITKSTAPFSGTDLVTALQSVKFDNSTHTGARTAPSVSLSVTDLNGLTSTPISYSVGMGSIRTATVGVSGGSVPTSIIYGDTVTLTSSASAGSGEVSYEVISGDCTLNGAALTMGTQTCRVRSITEFDGTYAKTYSDQLSFTSTPKTITISASSHSVTVGDAVPTIRPVVVGLVGADSYEVINGLTCSTTYTTSSDAGTYPSRCTGTPTATGYTFSGSVVDGTVTATAATSSSTVVTSTTTLATPPTTVATSITTVGKSLQKLPATGNQSSTMVLIAALLLATGLVFGSRRRFID